jgi:hypothetical protein
MVTHHICDFDLRFTFGVAGWPGSAHDTRILQRSIEKYPVEFPAPPGGNILSLLHMIKMLITCLIFFLHVQIHIT